MKNFISILIIACLIPLGLHSQEIKTVSTEIHEIFEYRKSNNLEINGERAEINIVGADIDQIEITAITNSKNESKTEAERDIKKMKVLLEKIGKTIYARNYISIKKDSDKPNSNLKVVFDIKVPYNCSLTINNTFGEVQITYVNGEVKLNTKYSKINLAYLEGQGVIESLLGDINIHSSYGEYGFLMSRCDLTMQNSTGSYSVNSKYGVVNAVILPELEKLKIVGVSVDVNLDVDDVSGTHYDLIAKDGKIEIDEDLNVAYNLFKESNIQKLELNKEIECSRLSIDTQFGSIVLNKNLNEE